MATISQVQINGTTYEIADATARDMNIYFTVEYPGTVSVPSGTTTKLITSQEFDPGDYLFNVNCYAASNNVGARRWQITIVDSAPSSPTMNESLYIPVSSTAAAIYTNFISIQSRTDPFTIYGWGTQNSGAALNMSMLINGFKLK